MTQPVHLHIRPCIFHAGARFFLKNGDFHSILS
nr:MAG TPA: hypothetical protein [Inoviridae sp.]